MDVTVESHGEWTRIWSLEESCEESLKCLFPIQKHLLKRRSASQELCFPHPFSVKPAFSSFYTHLLHPFTLRKFTRQAQHTSSSLKQKSKPSQSQANCP